MANKNHSVRSRLKYLLTATAVLCCTAIGVAYAANGGVNASGSVSAGSLSVGLTQMSPFTFKNEVPVIAQTVTVSNSTQSSSQQSAHVQVDLIGDGDSPQLVEETQLWAWPIQSGGTCNTTTAIPSGTNATNLSDGATLTGELAPGQSQAYCVRMQANLQNLYSSSGTISGIALKASATLSVGNFTTSSSNSSDISTYSMYPYTVPVNAYYALVPLSNPNYCLDVSGGVNAVPNAPLGTYTCYNDTNVLHSNQWFRFNDPNGASGTYSTMQPRIPIETGIQAGTTNGSGITASSINTSLQTQQWITQLVTPGQNVYQLVSVQTGLCLTTVGASNSVMLPCANLATQRLTFKTVNVAAPTSETDTITDAEPSTDTAGGEDSPTPNVEDQNQAQSGTDTADDSTVQDKTDGDRESGSGLEEDLDNSRRVEGAGDE